MEWQSTFILFAITIVSSWSTISGCRISEFFCDNGQCTGLDRFCDGRNDCGDKSDEPRQCTRCNRTYYGDRHKTYMIEIAKPKSDKLPYYCSLTFIAGGGELGDIVELSFEKFNVGTLVSHFQDGCSSAYMQIIENNRSLDTAGAWCGEGIRWNVYYSETSNVTLVLVASNLTDNVDLFEFRINYRFLSRLDAVTRYGLANSMHHRGELIPGTVCDRSYHDCDSQICRVQSPNFPGIYPRNVTCYYHITQITVPERQYAMIAVSQRNEEKLKVKTSQAPHEKYGGPFGFQRSGLWYGDECQHDFVKVYDGATTNDPVWLKFCRSGPLPEIISSGSEMLLEFHSIPYDHPELHSFELNVDVRFIPEASLGTRMVDHKCDWVVSSEHARQGALFSLQHSAPPGTRCSYHLRGNSDEIIWLYFVYFYAETRRDSHNEDHYIIRIELFNGLSSSSSVVVDNNSNNNNNISNSTTAIPLLDTAVGERVPRLCAHARNYPGYVPVRPCKVPEESYVSSGPELFLRYGIMEGARLDFVRFVARYEFVNTFQHGTAVPDTECDRIFSGDQSKNGRFSSPQNVFLFGRGGRQNLTCTFTFSARPSERVRIILKRMLTGRGQCTNEYNLDTRRYTCHHETRQSITEMHVTQYMWNEISIPLACVCEVHAPIEIEAVSSKLKIAFSVKGMNSKEDFNDYFFDASYEFVPYSDCDTNHYMAGMSGEIQIISTNEQTRNYAPRCPWFIDATADKYIYLRIHGITELDECRTTNRIAVFVPGEMEPLTVVCPGDPQTTGSVEVFSKAWNKSIKTNKIHATTTTSNVNNNNLIVELNAKEPGSYNAKYLKVAKQIGPKVLGKAAYHEDCDHTCPELNACISRRVWCDGNSDCPSGFDEADENCAQHHFPWLYVGVGGGCGAFIILAFVLALARRKREAAAQKGLPVPTDDISVDGKESEC